MSHEVPQSHCCLHEDEEAEGASEKRVLATLAAILSRFFSVVGVTDLWTFCASVFSSSSSSRAQLFFAFSDLAVFVRRSAFGVRPCKLQMSIGNDRRASFRAPLRGFNMGRPQKI